MKLWCDLHSQLLLLGRWVNIFSTRAILLNIFPLFHLFQAHFIFKLSTLAICDDLNLSCQYLDKSCWVEKNNIDATCRSCYWWSVGQHIFNQSHDSLLKYIFSPLFFSRKQIFIFSTYIPFKQIFNTSHAPPPTFALFTFLQTIYCLHIFFTYISWAVSLYPNGRARQQQCAQIWGQKFTNMCSVYVVYKEMD